MTNESILKNLDQMQRKVYPHIQLNYLGRKIRMRIQHLLPLLNVFKMPMPEIYYLAYWQAYRWPTQIGAGFESCSR